MAFDCGGEFLGVADVALDHLQIGIVGKARPEKQRVVDGDFMAPREQTRRQDMANISGAAGNQYFFEQDYTPPISGKLLSTAAYPDNLEFERGDIPILRRIGYFAIAADAMVKPAAFASL